jgi:hypothetical protein
MLVDDRSTIGVDPRHAKRSHIPRSGHLEYKDADLALYAAQALITPVRLTNTSGTRLLTGAILQNSADL